MYCIILIIFFFPLLQSVIQKDGFRSLGDEEEVEFTTVETEKGLEATSVRAAGGGDVQVRRG